MKIFSIDGDDLSLYELLKLMAVAAALGAIRKNLQLALDDKLAQITEYLLEYAGLESIRPVVTYRKKVDK